MATKCLALAKLLRRNRSAVSPFAGRYRAFCSESSIAEAEEAKMKHPFQYEGPGKVLDYAHVKEGFRVRITMPGVGENGIKVRSVNNMVFFKGEGEKEYEEDDCGRKYGGSIEVIGGMHDVDGIKVRMKNGILHLMVPKYP